MPLIFRRRLSVRKEKEIENMRADIEKQKEDLETQKLLTQYVADMNDIYIPEEEGEEDVRDIIEDEGQI